MSDFSEFSGIDTHCPELLLKCVKTLEMDDKAKFEEEEDRFCLDTDGLERQMSAWGATIDATMVGWVSSVYRHLPISIAYSPCLQRHPPTSDAPSSP